MLSRIKGILYTCLFVCFVSCQSNTKSQHIDTLKGDSNITILKHKKLNIKDIAFANNTSIDSIIYFDSIYIRINRASRGDFFTSQYQSRFVVIINDKMIINDSGKVAIKYNDVYIHFENGHKPLVLVRYLKNNFGNGDTLKCLLASADKFCLKSAFIPTPVMGNSFVKSMLICVEDGPSDFHWDRGKDDIDYQIDKYIDSVRRKRHY